MAYQQTIITPGFYEGSGRAKLLNANQQCYLFQNMRVFADQRSIAIQLERQKSNFYPYGAAVQVQFSGDPGAFELDVQAAEDDTDAQYVTVQTITQVNGSFVGRVSIMSDYVKFVSVKFSSIQNDVLTTVLITR